MKILWFGLGITALALLVGCAPPALPFNPAFQAHGSHVEWDHGTAWARQEAEGLMAKVAFIEGGPGAMLFDVVVENRSEKAMLVSPEQLTCEVLLSMEGPGPTETLKAVDPEIQVEALARARYVIERRREVESAVNGAFAIAGVAVAVADTADRATSSNREHRRNASTAIAGLDVAATALGAEVASSARASAETSRKVSERDRWELECFRRTTLHPDTRYRGKVVFHGNASVAGWLQLRVPMGNQVFIFPFRLRTTLPASQSLPQPLTQPSTQPSTKG